MTKVRVYDKLGWHEDGGETAGFFLGWAARRDLLGDAIAPKDARAAKAGKKSGLSLLETYGGSLASDLLSKEGNDVAAVLYAKGAGPLPKTLRALDAKRAMLRGPATRAAAVTPEVEARLVRLRARAKKKHAVEVEHLIAFAQLGDRTAAAPLRALSAEHEWPHGGRGVVPLGAWAFVVALYLELGAAAVARRAKAKPKEVSAEIAVSLLEELEATPEVVHALIDLAQHASDRKDVAVLGSALGAIGAALEDADFELDARRAKLARTLAHQTLQGRHQPIDAARCYVVLGAVGDASSLELVLSRPPLQREWKGSEKRPLAALRKRLR